MQRSFIKHEVLGENPFSYLKVALNKLENPQQLEQENGRTVRLCPFFMKDYNYRCPLCSCHSMTIYYTYNQTFLAFCAPSSQMDVKD